MTRIPAALLALLLSASCSAPTEPSTSQAETADAPGAPVEREGGQGGRDDAGDRTHARRQSAAGTTGENKEGTRTGSGGENPEGAGKVGTGAASDDERDTRPKVRSNGHGETAWGRRGDMPAPRSGGYLYAQAGWEEFCAGTCHRSDLPPSTEVEISVTSLAAGRLRVVSRSGSSDRSTRTTSFLTREGLDIAEVELRYGNFSNTYRPSPPVRSLRSPLRVGDAWTSEWRAETSGTYSAEVVAVEPLVVGERRVEAFKLDTVTTFHGDLRGTMRSLVWVDPETAMTLRTRGKARIASDFGRFNSNFDTMLLEGPGYP
jgi:hypothetical protein